MIWILLCLCSFACTPLPVCDSHVTWRHLCSLYVLDETVYGVQEGKARLKDWRLSSCVYLGVHCLCWASGCHVFVSLLSVSTLSVFKHSPMLYGLSWTFQVYGGSLNL